MSIVRVGVSACSVLFLSMLLSLLPVYSSSLVAVGPLGSEDTKLLSAQSDVFIPRFSPFSFLDVSVIPNADEVGLAADGS